MKLSQFQPLTSLERWAEASPDEIALVGPNASFTTSEFLDTLRRLAAGLLREGIQKGDVVGVDFGGEYSLLLGLALFHIGASWVPWSNSEELAHLNVSKVLTHLGNEAVELPLAVVIDQPWLESLEDASLSPAYEWTAEDLCYVTFSSGTTGARKTIGINAELLDSRLDDFVKRMEILFPVFSLFPPLTSISFHSVLVQLVERQRIYLPGSPAHNVDIIERFAIRCLRGSPNLLSDVISASTKEMRNTWALEAVSCTGGRMGATLVDAYREAPNCEVYILYGATEIGSISSGVLDPSSTSVGHIQDDVLLEVRSRSGEVLSEGQEGEVFIKREFQVNTYLSAKSDESGLVDGWFRPGDFGYVKNGELFLAGRTNERINAGGAKIDPLSADHIMQEYPDIYDAACFPIANDSEVSNWGVAIVPRPTFSAEAFATYCLDHFGEARPTLVVAVKELPRNAMGKINRALLAEQVLR